MYENPLPRNILSRGFVSLRPLCANFELHGIRWGLVCLQSLSKPGIHCGNSARCCLTSFFQEPFLRTLLDAVKIFVSGIKKSTFTSSIFLIPLPFHTTFHFRGRLPGGFLSARKSIKNRWFLTKSAVKHGCRDRTWTCGLRVMRNRWWIFA